MKKPKRKYYVLRDGECIGSTFAVSEKQAINNARYRYCVESYKNGFYPSDWVEKYELEVIQA